MKLLVVVTDLYTKNEISPDCFKFIDCFGDEEERRIFQGEIQSQREDELAQWLLPKMPEPINPGMYVYDVGVEYEDGDDYPVYEFRSCVFLEFLFALWGCFPLRSVGKRNEQILPR